MQTIVIASQKGGAGKSTLARNLAVAYAKSALIDLDPQGSTAAWWETRDGALPQLFSGLRPDQTATALKQLKDKKITRTIIDTPPSNHAWLGKIIGLADLVLVPVRPSADDLRAVGPTLDLIETGMTPFAFVITQATARAKIVSETARVLAQHGRVAPVNIGLRIAYAECGAIGTGVTEGKDKKAAHEITSLRHYVDTLIRKGNKHG